MCRRLFKMRALSVCDYARFPLPEGRKAILLLHNISRSTSPQDLVSMLPV